MDASGTAAQSVATHPKLTAHIGAKNWPETNSATYEPEELSSAKEYGFFASGSVNYATIPSLAFTNYWRCSRNSSHSPASARTNFVNFRTLSKFPACVLWRSSAINNSPRACVWLAGICCNSRRCPASKFLGGVIAFNCPGHGTRFGKLSFRRVPSKQGPPKVLLSIS
jgi:hypothetical protein